MATVVVPPPYRGPTGGLERVEAAGATVRECIDSVEARHPGFRPLVIGPDGRVHRSLKLFRNGDALMGDVLDLPIDERDELRILSPIAGG